MPLRNPYLRCLPIAILVARTVPSLYGDVGIIVYESKGVDQRRVSTGHIALVTTGLCASGTTKLRNCSNDEEPGAVLTRYANVASGYDSSLFVVPLRDHFTATHDPAATPPLSSGRELEIMQQDYWRSQLRSYLPPITEQQYLNMRGGWKVSTQAEFSAALSPSST